MNQMRVTVQEKLVVGYWQLVPMESGADNSLEKDTSKVTKELEEPLVNRNRTLWWKEQKWPRLKKALQRQRNPAVNVLCDAACLELGKDTAPQMAVANCLQSIVRKPITYKNAFPPRNQAFISRRQVKYVQYIIVTRDTSNLGMSRREVIHTISDIGQASYYVQAENHLYYLIWENQLANLKRHRRVIKSQSKTMELLHICVSQQYRQHMMIEGGVGGSDMDKLTS